MKIKISHWLVAVFFALTMLAASSSSFAYCRWVGGHYVNGHYVSKHKVCVYHHSRHCKWVKGYRRNGVWHDGHRVCW